MRATIKPEKPPRAPGNVGAKLCQEPREPAAKKQTAAMTAMRRALSQVRASWTFPALRVPMMLRAVMSHVATIAATWLQRRGPMAVG